MRQPPPVIARRAKRANAPQFAPHAGQVEVIERARLRAPLWRRALLAHAPAGYGKTTMLSQVWSALPSTDAFKPWLSLTPAHRAYERFLADLLDALSAAGISPPEWVVRPDEDGSRLAQMLSVQSKPVFLALDNYQAGSGPDVDAFVRALLAMIAGSARVALAGRERPSVGAAALAARGDLVLLGPEDLRFTLAETAALFEGRLDAAGVAALHDQAEGWPAALQLTRQAMEREGESPPLVIRATGGEVGAYLAEETFDPLPDELKALLIETAPLTHLDAGDVDHVRRRRDGAALLAGLEASGALVFSDRGQANVLRRHALLQAFLEARFALLSDTIRGDIAERSAECLARRGSVKSALQALRRFHPRAPRLALLEAAHPEGFYSEGALAELPNALAAFEEASFIDASRSSILRALAQYDAGRVPEARAAIAAALPTLQKRPGLAGNHEAKLWEGLRAALFDERLSPAQVSELSAIARRAGGGEGLPAHVASVLAVRAGRSEDARSVGALKAPHGASALGAAQRAITALFDAAPKAAAQALRESRQSECADGPYRAALQICEAWRGHERCEAWDEARLPALDASPLLLGFSPELLVEHARLAAWSAQRSAGVSRAREVLNSACAVASARGWARAEAALAAEELASMVRAGERGAAVTALAKDLAGRQGEQAPDTILALAQHDIARRAYASARARLGALLNGPALARRWRARALVMDARAALALGAVAEVNGALGGFLDLSGEGVMARGFHEEGTGLWEPLMALASRTATADPAHRWLDAIAELAISRPRFHGEAPLAPPTTQEALMFAALRRNGARAEAARQLAMSENTLKYYLKRAFEKWGVNDWRVAVRVAERLSG